jgi:hypothetical protein
VSKAVYFPCDDPRTVTVSVLDLNNIASRLVASGSAILGGTAILMFLYQRCQSRDLFRSGNVWDQTSKHYA